MPKNPLISPNNRRAIKVVAFPAVQLLDVAGPLQVFASANQIAMRCGELEPYEIDVVASSHRDLVTAAGLGIVTLPLPGPSAAVDTLIVAGGPGVHDAAEDELLVGWLRRRAHSARRVASVCTGAFLLGACGLLDGKRAVTHWRMCGELARRFPTVRVEPDPIFVRDGSIWTSAGVTAGIDLALALVEEDLGRSTALEVAQNLVVFLKRPGGQAQFSAALSLQGAEDRFDDLIMWMSQNLRGDLSLSVLAKRIGMSERSFSRHFTSATGTTPARAVERLRLEAASRLLSETQLPLKRIAERCGFGSEETLRRSFIRHLATTPRNFRDRFGP